MQMFLHVHSGVTPAAVASLAMPFGGPTLLYDTLSVSSQIFGALDLPQLLQAGLSSPLVTRVPIFLL